MTAKHAPVAELDVFVGNANGRGLTRIEERGTGQIIAAGVRGEKNEAQIMEIARRYNAHAELLAALRNLCNVSRKESDWKKAFALLARIEGE